VHCLFTQGKLEEAYQAAQLGMDKNPNHVLNRSMLSDVSLLLGKYEECERICRSILLQMPGKHSTITMLIWVLIVQGRPGEAIRAGEEHLVRTGQRLYFVVGRLALAYLTAGDRVNAERLYAEMEERSTRGEKGFPYFMALYQQVAGRPERALDLLEEYLPDRLTDYLWLKVQPEFKPLRGHPRFEAILVEVFGPSASPRPDDKQTAE
jgi:predicted Zn-dependent protease